MSSNLAAGKLFREALGLLRKSDNMKAFISHTSEVRDFPKEHPFLKAALDGAREAGWAVDEMADFPATSLRPPNECERRVCACDAFVGIVGFLWGSEVPDRPGVSYMKLELEAAQSAGKPTLLFVIDEDFTGFPVRLIQRMSAAESKCQQDFRQSILSGPTCKIIDKALELRHEVYRALMALDPTRTIVRPTEDEAQLDNRREGRLEGSNEPTVKLGYCTTEFYRMVAAAAERSLDILIYRNMQLATVDVLEELQRACRRGVTIRILGLASGAPDALLDHAVPMIPRPSAVNAQTLRAQLREREVEVRTLVTRDWREQEASRFAYRGYTVPPSAHCFIVDETVYTGFLHTGSSSQPEHAVDRPYQTFAKSSPVGSQLSQYFEKLWQDVSTNVVVGLADGSSASEERTEDR